MCRDLAVDYLETGRYPEDSYSKRVKVNLVRKLFEYESEAALTDAAKKLKEAAADVEFDESDCCFMEVATVVPEPGDAAAHWKQIEDEGSNVLLFGVLQGFFTRADAVSAFTKCRMERKLKSAMVTTAAASPTEAALAGIAGALKH